MENTRTFSKRLQQFHRKKLLNEPRIVLVTSKCFKSRRRDLLRVSRKFGATGAVRWTFRWSPRRKPSLQAGECFITLALRPRTPPSSSHINQLHSGIASRHLQGATFCLGISALLDAMRSGSTMKLLEKVSYHKRYFATLLFTLTLCESWYTAG